MKISAIILAAGQARRMGQNKLGLPVHGERMLDKVIQTVQKSNFGEIILVLNRENEHLLEENTSNAKLKVAINERPEDGTASSIRVALKYIAMDSQGLAFIMADQPYITAATMNRLIDSFIDHPEFIIIPQVDGQNGSPVIFPIDLLPAFEGLQGDIGGRQVINQFPHRVFYHEVERVLELKDIDTPKEYENLTKKLTCLVRGGGDLATGVVYELKRNGYNPIILETDLPSCIRTEVAFASAIREGGRKEIQGVTAQLVDRVGQAFDLLKEGKVPILIDPQLSLLDDIRPDVFIDAIIAKKNLGIEKSMAPLVIALGPGFTAGIDCHIAIETMRGPQLGELIYSGSPIANTGRPGEIAGEAENRVNHAQNAGSFHRIKNIGGLVEAGDTIAMISGQPVLTKIDGVIRGLISEGYPVSKGLKIADVDPRPDPRLAFTISDKALKLGRSVVKAIIRAD